MRKKIFFVFCLTLLAGTAKSQILISLLFGDKLNSDKIEFGLDGGLNLSSLHGLEGDMRPNFNLGFYFDFRLKNPSWKVHTGVMVKSNLGYKGLPVYSLNNTDLDNAFAGGEVDRKLSYFNIPVLAKYTTTKSIYAEAGIMIGLRTKAFDIFTNSIADKDDLEFKNDINDMYTRLDAGLMGGIGYRLMKGKGMNLGIRYYFGLVNILKDQAGPAQYNRSVYITLGIPVGSSKSSKTNTQSDQ